MSTENYAEHQNQLRQWCKAQHIDHYFLDGPLTDTYWSAKPRIAILNLEAYGYEKSWETPIGIDLMKRWMNATDITKTTRYTSIFVAALQQATTANSVVTAEALKTSFAKIESLVASMSMIAYVNVRKTSNSVSPQDARAILEASTGEWLRLLQLQFRLLRPEIIIVGGRLGCIAANRIFVLPQPLQFKGFATGANGEEIVSVKHFSRVNYSNMASVINQIVSRQSGRPEERAKGAGAQLLEVWFESNN
jgi:hypothetical protein